MEQQIDEPFTNKLKQLITILELVKIEDLVKVQGAEGELRLKIKF